MHGDAHVRFGGRTAETHRPKRRQGAAVRPLHVISTGEGWLYLASVRDLGSRRMISYSMADHMRTELVLDALEMAVTARRGHVAGVIAHADRGTQYTSNDYLDYCQQRQLRPSVGRTGVCWEHQRCRGVVLGVPQAGMHPRSRVRDPR